jgi:predicted dehydrogenase
VDVLRIGVLGSARISTPALIEPARQVPAVTAAAVAARKQPLAEAFAERHGIPVAYGSYDDLLVDPDIDAVYNALPTARRPGSSRRSRWTASSAPTST